ncbi:MAG: CGLD27 family protein, partial [Cyanobacteria bacterium P01_F01_bin.86]
MPVITSRCPVPPEQLPINQYQDMSQSWFYSWGSCELWPYLKPLLIIWSVSWIITGPVAAASFAPGKHPVPFVLWAAAGALILPILTLAQLYFGWLHVGQRLQKQAVPYEESGWYDGQV